MKKVFFCGRLERAGSFRQRCFRKKGNSYFLLVFGCLISVLFSAPALATIVWISCDISERCSDTGACGGECPSGSCYSDTLCSGGTATNQCDLVICSNGCEPDPNDDCSCTLNCTVTKLCSDGEYPSPITGGGCDQCPTPEEATVGCTVHTGSESLGTGINAIKRCYVQGTDCPLSDETGTYEFGANCYYNNQI